MTFSPLPPLSFFIGEIFWDRTPQATYTQRFTIFHTLGLTILLSWCAADASAGKVRKDFAVVAAVTSNNSRTILGEKEVYFDFK